MLVVSTVPQVETPDFFFFSVHSQVNMTSSRVLRVADIPSEPTVIFRDSSFFSAGESNAGNRLLPGLTEVLAQSQAQNSAEDHKKPSPPPVHCESLDLLVKFGRNDAVNISEGQCLWAIRRLLPSIPVPEIYGWSTEDGYVSMWMSRRRWMDLLSTRGRWGTRAIRIVVNI